ncbi:MAG: DUF1802 family protein [Chthoniobacterales bacterium]
MQRIGFKEWAPVCDALGSGRQSVIIRKGGIAEGRDGFAFRYRKFFLFPTFFHEQLERVRFPDTRLPQPRPDEIEIRFFAQVEKARLLTRWEDVRALAPLHILRESVVRERFEYDEAPGVHVAFVKIFRLGPVWRFPDAKAYGGCRSWVELPELPPGLQLHPVASTSALL